ncbi:MAG: hypothetical protein DRR19_01700 [Candidatus Parabeggiatoa sp. nov. 1]|nr:MAG: hypothetical protein DRR19_01700 [Gammaproteobacteria bacterium]
MIKKFIGKIVVALIKAMARAFVGMLMGIAFMGFILVMLLFFGVAAPQAGQEIMLMEIIGLLLVGAGIGAIAGFFDMLDFQRRSMGRARRISRDEK